MNENEKGIIYDKIASMAVLYGQAQTQQRITMYVELLAKYDCFSISRALDEIAVTSKFFPSLAEIIENIAFLNCVTLDPTEVANSLINSTYSFGEYRPKEAREYLGLEKWDIVEKFGGWRALCRFDESQKSTIRAQLRDLIKAINSNDIESFKRIGLSHGSEVEDKSRNKLKTIDFNHVLMACDE
jgi:hypothetical protein